VTDTHHALLALAFALAFGTLLIVVARRLRLPTIVLLLAGGIGLGPEGLGWIHPEALGGFLPLVVSLAVGIILFEGGLTLDLKGYLQGSQVIKRLLSLGVLVTWAGAALAVWYFLQVGPAVALLAGSLVIVTGPTVIVPILKRIRVKQRLHHILHWEGVLIDAIGVFIALLCFEWVTAQAGGAAVMNFAIRTATGLGLGLVGGWVIYLALKWRLAPDSMVNSFALAMAVLLFGLAEAVRSEAGLLAVTVAGLVVGSRHPIDLHRIREFKGEITELLIGLLFMLLSARLELDQFVAFGEQGLYAVLFLILVVRPLGVIACTWGSGLNWREKAFLSWVAPRGIVAASMASLFALALAQQDLGFDPRIIETFTYSVIVVTVVLQGFSAGFIAWMLRLRTPEPRGWMVLGAHDFSRAVAGFLSEHSGAEAVLLDRNPQATKDAAHAGHTVITGDALEPEPLQGRPELAQVGHLLALTDNSELNELACHRWSETIDRRHLYRWSTDGSARSHRLTNGQPVWSELPHPARVASEIRLHETRIEETEIDDPSAALSPGTVPLMAARDGRIRLLGTARALTYKKGDRVLLLHHTGSYLARALAGGALVELTEEDFTAPYAKLVAAARARHPKLDAKAINDSLTAQAAAFAQEVKPGIHLPNANAEHLPNRICLLGRHAASGQLAFLVLSPPDNPEGHLATLSEIARLCRDDTHREALLKAVDHTQVVAYARAHAHVL
jgi:NhaP-type Na+/H+ or K+/H+ antiporter